MKPKIFTCVFTILLFSFALFIADSYSQGVHKIQVQNKSAVEANDFHGEMSPNTVGLPGKAATASSKENSSGNKAFPDNVYSPPANKFYWPASSNITPIPADGGKMTVMTEPDKINTAKSYLTRDSLPIATAFMPVKNDLKSSGSNAGQFSAKNLDPVNPIVLTSLQVYVDNPTNPVSISGWSPAGTLVSGIPPSVTLLPGQTITFPFSYTNPGFYVSSHFFAAYVSEPADTFEFTDAMIQSSLIPTLTQWGLIILAIGLIAVGSVYIYKRRARASAI